MFDFVTITYNNHLENELLKLQAHSFKFVNVNIINNIIVLFNDEDQYNTDFFQKFFDEIIFYYPENLRHKVIIYTLNDINLKFNESSNWFTQQVCKIYISNKINTEFYILLDAKNHFIRNVDKNYFFNNENKPYLYKESHDQNMLKYYYNCLNYFYIDCPLKHLENQNIKYQTVTPFVFITEQCKNMIQYIENRENISFPCFFMNTKLYTEFFLYEAYILYTNLINRYHIMDGYRPFNIVGNCDPEIYYNNYDSKKYILEDTNVKIFGLHRYIITQLNHDYKTKLLFFYSHFYELEIINFIREKIFSM